MRNAIGGLLQHDSQHQPSLAERVMIKKAVALARTNIVKPEVVPSIGDIIFLSLLFVLAFSSGQGLLSDGDTGYHIRTGEIILQTWQLPSRDPYSFHYPPLPWTAHEWLSEIAMAIIFESLGLTGVVIFFAVLLALTHWLLYQSLRSRSNDILACAVVTLLATATSSSHWLARPHAFSLLLTVIWCHCLDRFQYQKPDDSNLSPISHAPVGQSARRFHDRPNHFSHLSRWQYFFWTG